MDGPRDYCTEWSKPDRERNIMWHHLFVSLLKKKEEIQMNLYIKQK